MARNMESTVRKSIAGGIELEREPRVLVGCQVCGSTRSQLVCSAQEIAAQHRFLESFYRSRWSRQDAATAIVACNGCGLLYRNPRPAARAVAKAYTTEQYDERYLLAELQTQRV